VTGVLAVVAVGRAEFGKSNQSDLAAPHVAIGDSGPGRFLASAGRRVPLA
jgi:hypothetical protein